MTRLRVYFVVLTMMLGVTGLAAAQTPSADSG
jgi:hypothetical protein